VRRAAWHLPNESVSFQPQCVTEFFGNILEDWLEISKVVSGSVFFSAIDGLDAGAAIVTGG
jgi:hypothetical protein